LTDQECNLGAVRDLNKIFQHEDIDLETEENQIIKEIEDMEIRIEDAKTEISLK